MLRDRGMRVAGGFSEARKGLLRNSRLLVVLGLFLWVLGLLLVRMGCPREVLVVLPPLGTFCIASGVAWSVKESAPFQLTYSNVWWAAVLGSTFGIVVFLLAPEDVLHKELVLWQLHSVGVVAGAIGVWAIWNTYLETKWTRPAITGFDAVLRELTKAFREVLRQADSGKKVNIKIVMWVPTGGNVSAPTEFRELGKVLYGFDGCGWMRDHTRCIDDNQRWKNECEFEKRCPDYDRDRCEVGRCWNPGETVVSHSNCFIEMVILREEEVDCFYAAYRVDEDAKANQAVAEAARECHLVYKVLEYCRQQERSCNFWQLEWAKMPALHAFILDDRAFLCVPFDTHGFSSGENPLEAPEGDGDLKAFYERREWLSRARKIKMIASEVRDPTALSDLCTWFEELKSSATAQTASGRDLEVANGHQGGGLDNEKIRG